MVSQLCFASYLRESAHVHPTTSDEPDQHKAAPLQSGLLQQIDESYPTLAGPHALELPLTSCGLPGARAPGNTTSHPQLQARFLEEQLV